MLTALSRAPRHPPSDLEETSQIFAVPVDRIEEFSELPKEPDCDLLNLSNSFTKEQRKDKVLNELIKVKKDGTLPSDVKRPHVIRTQENQF